MTDQVDGLYLSGYWDPDSRGVNVCGLTELSGFMYNMVKPPYEKYLEKIAKLTGWMGRLQGNFLFAVDKTQVIKASGGSFITFLLEHPNTMVIHSYHNNAHAPNNLVLICIHHMFPDKVLRPGIKNNLKDFL